MIRCNKLRLYGRLC